MNKKPVWVSYSGRDEDIVRSFILEIKDDDDNEYKIYTYKKYVDTDKPDERENLPFASLFLLKPSDTINSLIEAIGSGLRQIIILSESYINSEYCMKELMCCLIHLINSKPTESNEPTKPKPLIVTRNLNLFENDKAKVKRLSEDLTKLYELSTEKHEFKPQFRFNKNFSAQEISAMFYQELDPGNYGRIPDMSREVTDGESLKKIFDEYKPGIETDFSMGVEALRNQVGINLKKWLNTALGRKVNQQYYQEHQIEIEKQLASQFEQPETFIEDVHKALKQVVINYSQLQRKEVKQDVERLYSICSQMIVSTPWFIEVKAISESFGYLRFNNDKADATKILGKHFSFGAARDMNLNLGIKAGKEDVFVRNMIPIPALSVEERAQGYDLESKVEDLISKVKDVFSVKTPKRWMIDLSRIAQKSSLFALELDGSVCGDNEYEIQLINALNEKFKPENSRFSVDFDVLINTNLDAHNMNSIDNELVMYIETLFLEIMELYEN